MNILSDEAKLTLDSIFEIPFLNICWMGVFGVGVGINIYWYNICPPPPPFKVKFDDKLETVGMFSIGKNVILLTA